MKNSKLLLIGLLLLGCIIHLNAQSKGQIAKNLKERQQNSEPAVYTDLLNKAARFNGSLIENEVSNATVFNLDRAKALEIINQGLDLISLEIQLNNSDKIILDLYRETDAFSGLSVNLSDGTPFDMSSLKASFYRGIIRGNENSVVSLSIFENEVAGIISSEKGNLVLGKLKDNPQIILYNDKDLKARPKFDCDTPDLPLSDAELLHYQNLSSKALTLKCVRFAFETEYDIFQTLGSSAPNVVTYVTNLYNQVGTLYANDGISTTLSNIVVWNTPDPYTANGAGALLSQYQAQTSSINGDLGQLLTFRDVNGGIAAGFNGICNANVDERLCVSGGLTSSIVSVPTYSWNVNLVAHEFGHLFGSRHTHACVWNGNNTAIDGCAGFTEGGCPIPGIPSGGGTIMSYCHWQSVGVNFLNGFGPQPTAVITNRVNSGACLSSCLPCPANLVITTNVISPQTDYRQASAIITATNTIASGATGIYHAGTELVFQPGFISAAGSNFKAYIEGCTNNFLLRQQVLHEEPVAAVSPHKSIENNKNTENLLLAPNPTNGFFVVSLKEPTTGSIQISDLSGRIVYERKFKNEAKFEIDIQERPKGIYLVRVLTAKANLTGKIIKN